MTRRASVLALEPLRGLRVVAGAAALDDARWIGEVTLLRLAPDEILAIDATGVVLDDPDAIVEPEAGFAGAVLDPEALERVVAHTDWPLPTVGGALGQGKVAGVPVKLLMSAVPVLVVQTAYADELERRLG
jgi:hypothetical protein